MSERETTVWVGVEASDEQVSELLSALRNLAVVVSANADNSRLNVYNVVIVVGTGDNLEAEAWTFDTMRDLGFEPLWLATE